MLFSTTPTTNDKQGSGKFSTLRRRKKRAKKQENKQQEFQYLAHTDSRMRFNNGRDPIYYAFECIENRSVMQLMGDFIKDSVFEVTSFVSKAIK